MITTIIAFIIIFGILVFVHEFGHFFFARKSGILVREFSIGMGPKLFAVHRNGTTYTIRILPLGGYVRMAGLEDDKDTLKQGMPVSLLVGKDNKVKKINTSKKTTLFQGIPLEVVKWDLEKGLWIEGYENGDEDQYRHYDVDHDAMIIEQDGTEVQIAPLDVQFQSASVPKRIITNAAGAFNNFLLAIVAFFLMALLQGGVATSTNYVGQVESHSVAAKAGLKADDQIIKVNNHKTDTWDKLADQISANPNKKITLTVKKDGRVKKIKVTPEQKTQNGSQVGVIGITSKQHYNRSFGAIVAYGFTETWGMIVAIFSALGHMFTHGFSLNDFGGPVAMYSYTSTAAHYGLVSLVGLLAVLSVNLGVVNLLPIPALDGGKILLNIIEGVRGKPVDPDKEGIITLIGFAFLLLLMVLVTWNDIQRYFLH